MTTSNHEKVLNQISKKPAKVLKFKKYNVPRNREFGKTTKKCRYCGRTSAHISKYGLNFCRQCFRKFAPKIGFKKFN